VKCAFEHAFPENIIASVLRHGAKRQKQKQKTKTKKKPETRSANAHPTNHPSQAF